MMLTVRLHPPIQPLDHTAQLRPAGEIVEVKGNVVRLRERVEVAGGEVEEVGDEHRADGGHSFILFLSYDDWEEERDEDKIEKWIGESVVRRVL